MGIQRNARPPGIQSKALVEDCGFIDVREWMRGRKPDTETRITQKAVGLSRKETLYVEADYCRGPRIPYLRKGYLRSGLALDYMVGILSTGLHSEVGK